MSKYQIIYQSDNSWSFYDNEKKTYDSVDEAIKTFMNGWARDHNFKIITVVDWRAMEASDEQ